METKTGFKKFKLEFVDVPRGMRLYETSFHKGKKGFVMLTFVGAGE